MGQVGWGGERSVAGCPKDQSWGGYGPLEGNGLVADERRGKATLPSLSWMVGWKDGAGFDRNVICREGNFSAWTYLRFQVEQKSLNLTSIHSIGQSEAPGSPDSM